MVFSKNIKRQKKRIFLKDISQASPNIPNQIKTVMPKNNQADSLELKLAKLRDIAIHHKKISSKQLTDKIEGPLLSNGDKSKQLAQCIIGLDFGTAFTKSIARFRAYDAYPINWSNAVSTEDPYLLPSVFSENSDGTCVLGFTDNAIIYENIKMGILDSNSNETSILSITFLALVLRYIRHELLINNSSIFKNYDIQWELNIGLPTNHWDNQVLKKTYQHIARCAWALSEQGAIISIEKAQDMFNSIDKKSCALENHNIGIFPEFIAQISSYVKSPQRRQESYLHLLVDIGAGTVDIVTFNVHAIDDEDIFPIFEADVCKLGAHYFIKAIASESENPPPVWMDHDAQDDLQNLAAKYSIPFQDLNSLYDLFANNISTKIKSVLGATKRVRYPTAPAWINGIPTIFSGGGCHIAVYQSAMERVKSIYKIEEVIPPIPQDLISKISDTDLFQRLSVAYGLSYNQFDLGKIKAKGDVENMLPTEQISRAERLRNNYIDN
jgi:hypothetical protein